MADCQITCITKPNVNSSHEHITHVGNPANSWKITVEQAINNIKNGVDTFFVRDQKGNRAEVRVVPASSGRREHLRTVVDGKYTDNLLAMSQCPLH
jgi:hypothetical protein